jgi:hypothetical protein
MPLTHIKTRTPAAASKLPPDLQKVVESQPARIGRRTAANLITQHLYPVSHRSLEAWPLLTQIVNGKATVSPEQVFQTAIARLSAAPIIMGGRRETKQGG